MGHISLKALHHYLRLLENPSELKRRMPASFHQRSLRDGLLEVSKLVELEPTSFRDPVNIAAVLGSARFVRIWGEPSLPERVARVFDGTRLLFSMIVDPSRYDQPASGHLGATSGGGQASLQPKVQPPSWATTKIDVSVIEQDLALESLKPLLAGNLKLTCDLIRALFEHLLSSAPPSAGQQGTSLLVHDLTGTKENGKSFLPTALFLLGKAVAETEIVPFMMEQGLFGIAMFEHLLQNRGYCEAHYSFRRLERAIGGSPDQEELLIHQRIEGLISQQGGQASTLFNGNTNALDKRETDAHLAAADVLEALALTPFGLSLRKAICDDPSNCVRSIQAIAGHFVQFASHTETMEQANQEIADHLLGFARQFSTPDRPAPHELEPLPVAS